MLNSEEPNIKKEVGEGAETYEGGKDRTFREVGGEPGECHAGDQWKKVSRASEQVASRVKSHREIKYNADSKSKYWMWQHGNLSHVSRGRAVFEA